MMTARPAPHGRRRVTSHTELEQIAFGLFAEKGFEQTTVDDIAAAAGIGRRTFFRYFPSKNDVPWGMVEEELARMRARLKLTPSEVPLTDAIRQALVDFNRLDPGQIPMQRRRMELILRVPALLAHSAAYEQWLDDENADLGTLLDYAMRQLGAVFRGEQP